VIKADPSFDLRAAKISHVGEIIKSVRKLGGVELIGNLVYLGTMKEPITTTSQISANEFAGVSLRMSLRTDPFFYLTMLFGFGLVWGNVRFVVQRGGFQIRDVGSYLFGLFGLYCFAAPLRRWLLYKRQYEEYPQLRRMIEFCFDLDRFAVKTPDGEAEIPWSETAKLWKVGHFMIILLRKKQNTYIYYVNTRNLSAEQIARIRQSFRESRTKR
jgi:hypothetical protein